eukprot:3248929-Amphidinium_carterae.1
MRLSAPHQPRLVRGAQHSSTSQKRSMQVAGANPRQPLAKHRHHPAKQMQERLKRDSHSDLRRLTGRVCAIHVLTSATSGMVVEGVTSACFATTAHVVK